MYGASTTIDLTKLYATVERLHEIIGLDMPRNKAVVGEYVFATEAGIHQAGIIENPVTYEFLDPAAFGRRRRFVIGRHSGRGALRHLVHEAGLPLDETAIDAVYEKLVNEEHTDGSIADRLLLDAYQQRMRRRA